MAFTNSTKKWLAAVGGLVLLLPTAGCPDIPVNCINAAECNDDLTCTLDQCIDGICVNDLKSGRCLIDGACFVEGAIKETDQCGGCKPEVETTLWVDICLESDADVTDQDSLNDADSSGLEVTPDINLEAGGEDIGIGDPGITDATPDEETGQEVTPDVPAEVTPDVPLEVTPDVPAEVTPDVPMDTGPPTCEPSQVCAPPAEAGWSGPVIVGLGSVGGTPPACLGNWPTEEANGSFGLEPGPASCACSCDDPSGHSCTGTGSLRDQSSCASLPILEDSWTLNYGSCTAIGTQSKNYYTISSSNLSYQAGTCTPVGTPNFGTPTFGGSARVCGGATVAGSCGADSSGSCVPAPPPAFQGELCIVTPTDVPCPAGPYSVKRLISDDYADQRDCECSCKPSTGTCTGRVTLVNSSSCLALPTATIEQGQCEYVGGPHTRARLSATVDGSCQASTGKVTGDVVPTGTVTACCLPPN